jgi:hypothetical protein
MKGPASLRGRDVGLSEFFAKMVEFEAGGQPRWTRPATATDNKDQWREARLQRTRALECSVKCAYDLKRTAVQPPVVDKYFASGDPQVYAVKASDHADRHNRKQYEMQKPRCQTADGRRKGAMQHCGNKRSTAGDQLVRCYSARS